MNFEPFPKIARLSRECVITEKIDGTNAQVFIAEEPTSDIPWLAKVPHNGLTRYVAAGSRNRWLSSESDNYGFALWVLRNADELVKLGPGRHFGEWWGLGIQRGYGLKEKRFSLFNVDRWVPKEFAVGERFAESDQQVPPPCCHVVPVLYRGIFHTSEINAVLESLVVNGSSAAPGFMDVEGIVIFHTASRTLFKKTVVGDESPKGAQ